MLTHIARPHRLPTMSTLLFPTSDALRLALSSGVVPPDAAARPVRAAVGGQGELWLDTTLPTDVITRLPHLGVTPQARPPDTVVTVFHCWAALLPLIPHDTACGGPAVVEVPTGELANFTALLRRLGSSPTSVTVTGVVAYVRVEAVSAYLFTDCAGSLAAYRRAAAGVWVRHGWRHPLPEMLAPPRGVECSLVDSPYYWRSIPAMEVPRVERSNVCGTPVSTPPPSPRAAIGVPLQLRKAATSTVNSIWVAPVSVAECGEVFGDADPDTLRCFEYAACGDRLVLRWADRRTTYHLAAFRALSAHPAAPWMHLPPGSTLLPTLRADRLAALFNPAGDATVWVEPDANGRPQFHRVPNAAFSPLAELVTHAAPPTRTLNWHAPAVSPFAFIDIGSARDDETGADEPRGLVSSSSRPPAKGSPGGWLSRVAGRLFRPALPVASQRSAASQAKSARRGRIGRQKCESPATPTERSAHRRELERLILDRGSAGTVAAAGTWAELADSYAESGNPADGAVCWLNALWDHPRPPREWADRWLALEVKWAKSLPEASRRAARGRVAAATLVTAGSSPNASALVELVAASDLELPLRAVWLARQAAATACGGDTLGLAACRDRLFARLAADGAAVDLDAPSVLRFHAAADGDRYRGVSDWLARVREPIARWLERQASGRRLGWAGLDADVRASTAYADLMLAWGLARLGDRTRADTLETAAEAALARCGGTGVDPAVHATLLGRFKSRIRSARLARAEVSAPRPHADDCRGVLSAYAVERLTSRSSILGDGRSSDPYSGADLAAFLGTDMFGSRLARLRQVPSDADAMGLLQEASIEPTANVLPRAVIAVGEACGGSDATVCDRLLRWVPRAVELLPETVRLACPPEADRRSLLVRLTSRLLVLAASRAVRHDLSGPFGAILQFLAATLPENEPLRVAVGRSVVPLFRAVRKLGLASAASQLLASVPTDAPEWATGFFLIGQPERGVRLLDDARERLFVTGLPDVRQRTSVALGYAAGLSQAPPTFALGRLVELFQRLGELSVASAAARYYALAPLELVDTAVAAAVSDDFGYGPHVRGWLDDDEFLIRRRITRDLTKALALVP